MMPNADAIALGKQIKAVRKAMKMTQEQLALKSNVCLPRVDQYPKSFHLENSLQLSLHP